jgi:hypothetical protein
MITILACIPNMAHVEVGKKVKQKYTVGERRFKTG